MRHRSPQENVQSGPLAPSLSRSNQAATAPRPKLTTKKGNVGSTSARHLSRPCFHQATNKSTAGNENAVAFARSAPINSSKAAT